jgi:hypothetical protein
VPGVLSRNGEIEETGVAAGVLGHPPRASRGSRTSSPSTVRASRRARSSWPDRSPGRCGCRRATRCARLRTDGSHRMPLRLSPTFRDRLAAGPRRPCRGWVCTGSPLVAEIMAGSGLDWLLVDMEHPNTLRCSRSCRRRGSPRHPSCACRWAMS